MVKNFLLERRRWILFSFLFPILLVIVAYLDPALPLKSIYYVLFLWIILFLFFLIIAYIKETKFIKSIEDWYEDLDISSITKAESPFEKIIQERLFNQTNRLKSEASLQKIQSEQEKDDLMAWIHEVKTPLTAMSLIIDRMEETPLKSQLAYEWLRIHLLLDQQQHQKRLPFMENDLYIEKVDLQKIVFTEVKSLQSWCMPKGIGFDIDLQETVLLTDAKWLSFILRQLITNAIKYSEKADIVITSRVKDDHIIIEVTDFGRGIAPKDLPRIFEKGFTSTTNHQDSAATGMGLYLAEKAAESLNIVIQVESELGLGTTFTLIFPNKNEFVNLASM
ncbi:sensor histidine kinase [Mesobacillus maritimus]|uniref:sensor histidine kinase n=1 Tax=Mesobacillus maritimus TaxID=1643336 RepID=UPI00203F74E4|nr:sensor histidine kinase [Mesobacillus maritimus]MCM3585892.1 sensor histidine kinase [Mesobacillus maritimus]